jgi:hypothetical protein
MMLDVMQVDSRKWPTLADLNTKVDENVVLPQTILNYGEYQKKLQNLAFYAEQGDHESMQKLLDKDDVMEKKNVLLQPIFRDIKSAIRHMTNTDEYKLIKELQKELYDILSNHTGQNYDTIFKDCDRDNWMTAEESKAYGLVDEVLNRKSPK